MSKLDEIKEILNTLRVAMSISFGILVVTITGLVKRLDVDNVDMLFWTGIVFFYFGHYRYFKVIHKNIRQN